MLNELWQNIKEIISWLKKSGLDSSELYIKLSEISTKIALMREPPMHTKEFEIILKRAFEIINELRKNLSQGSFNEAINKLSELNEIILKLEKSSHSALTKFIIPFVLSASFTLILAFILILYLQVFNVTSLTYIGLMLTIAIAICLAFSAIVTSFLHARISALALLSSTLILMNIIIYIYSWSYPEFWISLVALSLVTIESLFVFIKARKRVIKVKIFELPKVITKIEISPKIPSVSKEVEDLYKELEKHYIEIYGPSGSDILKYEITSMMRAGLSYEESLKKLWERLGSRGKFVSSTKK